MFHLEQAYKHKLNKIEMVQRRAARYVTNRQRNTSSVGDMLQHLKWRSLEDRRRGVPCHDVFIKSPTTRLQSVKVTDFHHP